MKNLIITITLILSISVCAQNKFENANIFVRVYNLEGKKISKGKIISISETSLELKWKRESAKIMVNEIGSIKTKRSAGNNVIVGAGTGATVLAFLGAATADPDAWILGYTVAEGAAAGALIGGTTGAAIGGMSILFKNSETYEINGEIERLKAFKKMITN